MSQKPYLAMVTVNEQRVVVLVQDNAEDRVHGLKRDLLFLGSLHVEGYMLDAIGCDE